MNKPYRRRYPVRNRGRRSGRSRTRKFFDYLLTFSLFAGLAIAAAYLAPSRVVEENSGKAFAVDGDTLMFENKRVRLVGIDAPELGQTCKGRQGDFPCGREARSKLRALIGGQAVKCSGWQTDRYGRLLVECFKGDINLNQAMVESGWAISYGDYENSEAIASRNRAGLWAGDFERPQDWRKAHEGVEEETHDVDPGVRAYFKQVLKWLGNQI
ncbi:MAG: thermonuclease family protein [Phyllobacterium sp.]